MDHVPWPETLWNREVNNFMFSSAFSQVCCHSITKVTNTKCVVSLERIFHVSVFDIWSTRSLWRTLLVCSTRFPLRDAAQGSIPRKHMYHPRQSSMTEIACLYLTPQWFSTHYPLPCLFLAVFGAESDFMSLSLLAAVPRWVCSTLETV